MKHPKVGSLLDDLIAGVQAGEISAEEAAQEAPLHRGDSIGVAIHLSGNVESVVRFLESNGASNISARDDYIEAYVPVLLLAETSQQPGVVRVRPIQPPVGSQSGSGIPGNGPAVHGSAAWNQAGYTGSGVKVGVIDSGFDGFDGLMGTEVPASVQVRCYPSLGEYSPDLEKCRGGSHGTEVAESVMDIAPNVTLYIADPQSHGDLSDTVDWMISEGVSVINHSRTWQFDGLGDGTSPYAFSPLNTVKSAVAAGTVWVNAAGNDAGNTWFRRNPTYSEIPVGGEVIRFINFYESEGESIIGVPFVADELLQLRWEDSWTGRRTKLALYVIDDPGGSRTVPTEVSSQLDPVVFLDDGEGVDLVLIAHLSGEYPDWVQLVTWGGIGLPSDVSGPGSITNPAESANPGMLTVGAAHWSNVSSIESYSSRGPTPDGRIKPDLVGAACGQSAADPEFCGTSQASPHVAGLAALVRERFPGYAPAQVVSYLKENAEQRISTDDPNNTWGHGFIVLPPLFDLVVELPTVDTSAPAANASFTLSATVRNQGSSRSDSTTLRYYQSSDSIIATGDTELDTDSVSGIDPSESGDGSVNLTAPSTPGTYYYGACVDPLSGESDTTNNCSASVVVTVGAVPAPDLVVDVPSLSESAPAASASFTLSATVRNQGNSRSDSTTLRYYQSSDSIITTGDTELDTDSVSGIGPSESGEDSISLTAPSTPGTYYYGACVETVTDESDTTNNCSAAVTVTVGAAPVPDLVVNVPTVSESAPAAGATFTLSAAVRNQGNGQSDSTTLRYYQSGDPTITTGDTEVGTDSVSRLDPSESGDESVSLNAPSTSRDVLLRGVRGRGIR